MAVTLDRLIGWTIADHDDPGAPSVVTAVSEDAETFYLHTAAGWSFGGKRAYLGVTDYGTRVEVAGQGLQATLTPQEAA